MPIVSRLPPAPRVLPDGSAVEFDLGFEDNSTIAIQLPYSMIPVFMRAIWNAAARAETMQRQAAGERMTAMVVPYRMQDMRTGRSPDGIVVADFRTAQGPVQIAMTADQTRLTIQRLTEELERLSAPFPKPS
jgi:hypothetical protein